MIEPLEYGPHVKLVPFQGQRDWDYLMDLAEMDEGHYATREQIAESVRTYGFLFWVIEHDGVRSGVGLCLKVNENFLMEALKDKSVSGSSLKHSIEVGQMMLDQIFKFTNVVHTCARAEDKAIQILCRKLKFIEMGIVTSPYGKIMLFQKEKNLCQSLRQ